MKKNITMLLICILLCSCGNKEENKSWCLVNGCYNIIADNSAIYCEEHIGTNTLELQYQKEMEKSNNTKLTEVQSIKCRSVVEEYCEMLKKNQSNIKNIHVYDKEPETTPFYIKYDCYVNIDGDVRGAIIYVKMSDEGTFEVSELEFDE